MLRHAPVTHPPGMVTVSHSVPLDATARDFQPSAHPTSLLDPVDREPRRQAVRIAVVAESVMNTVERELDSYAVAVIGQQAGLAQLGLRESESVEREFVKVSVVRYPALMEVQRQRSLVSAPNADVVPG